MFSSVVVVLYLMLSLLLLLLLSETSNCLLPILTKEMQFYGVQIPKSPFEDLKKNQI